MRRNIPIIPAKRGLRLFAAITLAAAALTGQPASAQTPPTPAPQAATANLVTKADLQATGAQLGRKIDAQTDRLAALRQQILAMQAQLEAVGRHVNGMKVPAAPTKSRVRLGR